MSNASNTLTKSEIQQSLQVAHAFERGYIVELTSQEMKDEVLAGLLELGQARQAYLRNNLNLASKKLLDEAVPSWLECFEDGEDAASVLIRTCEEAGIDFTQSQFHEDVIRILCDNFNYQLNYGTDAERASVRNTLGSMADEIPSYFGSAKKQPRASKGFAVR